MQQVVVGIQYPAAKESHRKFISQKDAQRNTLFHSSKIFACHDTAACLSDDSASKENSANTDRRKRMKNFSSLLRIASHGVSIV